jgi:hypothetical protein
LLAPEQARESAAAMAARRSYALAAALLLGCAAAVSGEEQRAQQAWQLEAMDGGAEADAAPPRRRSH